MKNLIVLYESKKYLIDSTEELITLFLGEGYLKLSQEEKFLSRFRRAFGLSRLNKVDLIDTRIGTLGDNGNIIKRDYNILNSFVLDNEKTYILSLCKYREFVILENRESNIFGSISITDDDDNLKDNYVVVNKFLDQLLLKNLRCAS